MLTASYFWQQKDALWKKITWTFSMRNNKQETKLMNTEYCCRLFDIKSSTFDWNKFCKSSFKLEEQNNRTLEHNIKNRCFISVIVFIVCYKEKSQSFLILLTTAWITMKNASLTSNELLPIYPLPVFFTSTIYFQLPLKKGSHLFLHRSFNVMTSLVRSYSPKSGKMKIIVWKLPAIL